MSKLLLSYFSPHKEDLTGNSAFVLAVEGNHEDIVRIMLQHPSLKNGIGLPMDIPGLVMFAGASYKEAVVDLVLSHAKERRRTKVTARGFWRDVLTEATEMGYPIVVNCCMSHGNFYDAE